MEDGSRVRAARRRLRSVRYAIGIAAGIAFAGLALLARAAHPGSSHASSAQAAAPATAQQGDGGFFAGGAGSSIAPAQSFVPQVRSGGS